MPQANLPYPEAESAFRAIWAGSPGRLRTIQYSRCLASTCSVSANSCPGRRTKRVGSSRSRAYSSWAIRSRSRHAASPHSQSAVLSSRSSGRTSSLTSRELLSFSPISRLRFSSMTPRSPVGGAGKPGVVAGRGATPRGKVVISPEPERELQFAEFDTRLPHWSARRGTSPWRSAVSTEATGKACT
jgi:hypothetical protein